MLLLIASMPQFAWFELCAACVGLCVVGLLILRFVQRRRRVASQPVARRLFDAATLAASATLTLVTVHLLLWFVFGNLLYRPSSSLLKDLPESIHDDVIWQDKLENLTMTLPFTVEVSAMVAVMVVLNALLPVGARNDAQPKEPDDTST